MRKRGFNSAILHSDLHDGVEHGSVHKPVHTAVAFAYEDAHDLAAVFQGRKSGMSYGRQSNPTVDALAQKVTRMESGFATVCFGTGMGAIGSTLFALLRSGDHFVSSSFLFGNTNSLFNSYARQGLDVSFVDATAVDNVAAAINDNTRLVFVETIANPRTQIADLARIGQLCAQHGLIYVVDNTMTSPFLFQPRDVGAHFSLNSLTKYIGGHANALGGSITDLGGFDWTRFENIDAAYKKGDADRWGITQIRKKGLRDFGAALGPEAAHHIAVGAETLGLRMERASANASRLAEFCAAHKEIDGVYFPGLTSHPQHHMASELFRYPGALFSFELSPDLDPFVFLNALEMVVSSSNLGDNRTLAIPVAHTIYFEMGPERRASMGIKDSLIRVSVGIEDIDDLLVDFDDAISAAANARG